MRVCDALCTGRDLFPAAVIEFYWMVPKREYLMVNEAESYCLIDIYMVLYMTVYWIYIYIYLFIYLNILP